MVPTTRLVSASEQELQEFDLPNENYSKAIGKISYLQVATPGGLSFATSQLLEHLEKPGILHWIAFKHLLCSIKGTLFLCQEATSSAPSKDSPQFQGKTFPLSMHPVLKDPGVVHIWYNIPLCTIFTQQSNGDSLRTKLRDSK
ncbi:hypothetical protein O181_017337 [Austropuccinia psidii MF-1]|uniref:Uncharacterized protein n=1 Tax=Austropuccinia psidii MF-1 TaxID=1389203 RepID=A0A9Q3C5Q0_9BASI|nr:hypothetical protein [Austropuccinia psidii MF-1]